MIEKLIPIKLPPGLFHNGTRYDSKGRWYDGNLVRWREGILEPVGLWAPVTAGAAEAIGIGSDMQGLGDLLNARIVAWPSLEGPRVVVGVVTAAGDPLLAAFDPTDFVETNMADITPAMLVGAPATTQWTLNVFGGKLVATMNSESFEWSGDLAVLGTQISDDPLAQAGTVSTPERFLVALGTGGDFADNNPRKVQWADQETTDVWPPLPTNTAGDFTLQTDGTILAGKAAKGQTLIWTDTDMWTMTYIGGTLVYSFRQEGTGCGIVSPEAAAIADGRAFWMGRDGFFMFDGFVRPLPCDVHDAVFGDSGILDSGRAGRLSTVQAFTMSAFGEIWWLFNASTHAYNSRYVVYNYREGHWSYGTLDRAAGCDAGVVPYPMMISKGTGTVYLHESSEGDHSGSTVFVESGPIEIGDGDRVMRLQRIVPDGVNLTDARMKLYSSMFPVETETASAYFTLANPIDVRISAKLLRLRVEEVTAGVPGESWRMGTTRFGLIPQGRR